MKRLMLLSLLCLAAITHADDAAEQQELDQKCEAARQIALAPLKQEVYAECVAAGKDKSLCQSQADNYNGVRADRGPMFYDLPECQKAFNFRNQNSESL